ncbi:MAG: protein kinase, partial [Chloroflexi bacterium]|nr:protein kinase [Chloroflexota bacterium]
MNTSHQHDSSSGDDESAEASTPTHRATETVPRSARRSLQPGDRVTGRYRIDGILGHGGMGDVYLCYDETSKIQVALKALPIVLSSDETEMAGVLDNFRLVEGLHHPNIAAAKTLERDPETMEYLLVLEYVKGVTLHEYRETNGEDGRLALAQTMLLLRQIADALDYAHSRKILHRDIKPSNIIVAPDGTAKLLDFGIARKIHSSLTRVSGIQHEISGTAPYMAPEQWRGGREDTRTDQYSLAVTVYELLAARRPFDSQDVSVLAHMVLNEEPVRIEHLGSHTWAALRRGMAREQGQRFFSCREFVDALQMLAEPTGAGAPEIPSGIDSVTEQRRRFATGLGPKWTTAILLLLTMFVVAVMFAPLYGKWAYGAASRMMVKLRGERETARETVDSAWYELNHRNYEKSMRILDRARTLQVHDISEIEYINIMAYQNSRPGLFEDRDSQAYRDAFDAVERRYEEVVSRTSGEFVDDLLYQMAHFYLRTDRVEPALARLTQVQREFPNSNWREGTAFYLAKLAMQRTDLSYEEQLHKLRTFDPYAKVRIFERRETITVVQAIRLLENLRVETADVMDSSGESPTLGLDLRSRIGHRTGTGPPAAPGASALVPAPGRSPVDRPPSPATTSLKASQLIEAWSTPVGFHTADIGDVDGDGRLELVGGTGTGFVVFTGRGRELSSVKNVGQVGLVADIDGDGKAEVIVSDRQTNGITRLRAFTKDGTKIQTYQVKGGEGTHLTPFCVDDLEGDGHTELLAVMGAGYTRGLRGIVVFDAATGHELGRTDIGPAVQMPPWVGPVFGVGHKRIFFGSHGVANGRIGKDGSKDSCSYVWCIDAHGVKVWRKGPFHAGGYYDSNVVVPEVRTDNRRGLLVSITEHGSSDWKGRIGRLLMLSVTDGTEIPGFLRDFGTPINVIAAADFTEPGRKDALVLERNMSARRYRLHIVGLTP